MKNVVTVACEDADGGDVVSVAGDDGDESTDE